MLENLEKYCFNIVKVYNNHKKRTLCVLYTNNELKEVERELCYYGNNPFTKKEIKRINNFC